MSRYRYDGAVTSYGRLITDEWVGETIAPTKEKAKNNLIFQCKRSLKLLPTAKIEFSGSIEKVMRDADQMRRRAM